MKRLTVVAALFVCGSALAWDVEHDEVAQLTADNLPAEVRAALTLDPFGENVLKALLAGGAVP